MSIQTSRRQVLKSSLCAAVSLAPINGTFAANQPAAGQPGFELSRQVPTKLFDGQKCWCHTRAGIVPGAGGMGKPRAVLTMNTVDLIGSDVFRGMYGISTDDLGENWTEPAELKPMATRFETIDGQQRPVAASDFWPKWHAKSGTLLGTGHSVVYTPDWKVVPVRPRQTVFAAYNSESKTWSDWQKLILPDTTKFAYSGAGSTQRVDQADGTILLPFSFTPPGKNSHVAIMRCGFDGAVLTYLEHGDELAVDDTTRGIGEPSLAHFDDRYFLTIRHDQRGYVTRSRDGQHFEPIRTWTFDDGSDLGNYNTQQHWVTHSDGLFLVYTRRGANNDHVFRHRAPLFMARVDPEKLHVIRSTEQILAPERGARLCNFGVTDVSPDETWVTVAEWMQPRGCEKYGSDGSVYVAKLRWNKPNRSFV